MRYTLFPAFEHAVPVMVGCLLLVSLSAAQIGGVRIKGQVTDTSGAVLPGATVTATAPNDRQIAIADGSGRFELTGLPPGVYVLTAGLLGFKGSSREVTVTTQGALTADLVLRFDPCNAECVCVVWDAADMWRQSSLVAHLRIRDRSEPIHSENDCGRPAYQYTATAIRELTHPSFTGATARSISILTNVDSSPDSEYIGWLVWSADVKAFRILFNVDTAMVSRVADGRVEWHGAVPHGVKPHTTVNEFFAALTALSRRVK